MKITIENYILETNEHGKFNLIELRKWESKSSAEGKVTSRTLCYGVSLPAAIRRIVHMNLHYNPNVVNLQQFVVEYKNEYDQIKKLFEIAKIRQK